MSEIYKKTESADDLRKQAKAESLKKSPNIGLLRSLKRRLSRAELAQHNQEIVDVANKYFGKLKEEDRKALEISSDSQNGSHHTRGRFPFIEIMEVFACTVSVAIVLVMIWKISVKIMVIGSLSIVSIATAFILWEYFSKGSSNQ